jgi:hypothetical protein
MTCAIDTVARGQRTSAASKWPAEACRTKPLDADSICHSSRMASASSTPCGFTAVMPAAYIPIATVRILNQRGIGSAA